MIAIIVTIILGGGDVMGFVHIPSIFIVFGGTLASTAVAYPMHILKNAVKVISLAFKKKEIDVNTDIQLIIKIANIARREGLLALEDAVEDVDNDFLKKGIMLIVDGADTELIKNVLETEIYFAGERHAQGQAIVKTMNALAPAFGMVGTLIGLINMLAGLSDPDALGPGMSTALITTFYGSLLSNLIFAPIANKLKTQSDAEQMQKQLLMEGLLSIQDGENPRIIEDKLTSFIARGDIKSAEEASAGEVKEVAE